MKVYVVTGEPSGDALAAPIVAALRTRSGEIELVGVGGPALEAEGLTSLFPLSDISVMGLSAVVARLPTLIRRINQTVQNVVAEKPDLLLLVDSPDFTQRVGARVRRLAPSIPIVKVVSPSVWAWRPGRARKMAGYIDHLLALLPFEPEVHRRLGGPPTTYIGHPLSEVTALLEETGRHPLSEGPRLLLLPGSRAAEIARNMDVMRDATKLAATAVPNLRVELAAVSHLAGEIAGQVADWPVSVDLIGPADKHAAMRRAHAALAVSGTVTLELALATTPMAVVYKLDPLVVPLRFLVKVPSIVLPNLAIGRNAFPEFIHDAAEPSAVARALVPLLSDTPVRATQIAACEEVRTAMRGDGRPPSEVAADTIIDVLRG